MSDYFRYSRSAWYSYLFVLPLLVLYQLTALLANLGSPRPIINGADGLLQGIIRGVGLHGWLGSWLVAAVLVGIFVYRADASGRKGPLRLNYFPLVLLESAAYALVLGTLVAWITSILLPGLPRLQIGGGGISFGQKLAAGLGAGLYEELVFRLLLAGGLLWAFRKFGMKDVPAVISAVLVSSFIFSAFHYVGTHPDVFTLASFTFRFVAGVVLAALFAARGFAVAAWTHALYDVFLLFAQPNS